MAFFARRISMFAIVAISSAVAVLSDLLLQPVVVALVSKELYGGRQVIRNDTTLL